MVDERFIKIYRRYIAEQCELVILGAFTIDYHLNHGPGEDGENCDVFMWAGIRMVLTGAANLHRAEDTIQMVENVKSVNQFVMTEHCDDASNQ